MTTPQEKKEASQKKDQDFDRIIQKYNQTLGEFYKGNPEPYYGLYSNQEDISLLGAFGGVSVGQEEVKKHAATRAAFFQGGHNLTVDYKVKSCEGDFGYAVGIERFEAMVEGKETRVALRATTVFRREDGIWKIVHRQGDPLVYLITPAIYRSLAKHNEEMGGKL